MAITIKDIARVAGVSHTTVSRALHDHPAISSETIAEIKQLAENMGYMPNATARGLKTRRTRALGVIVSNIDDPFWMEVVQGIDEVLHPAGYSLFMAATHRDKQREKEVVQAMVQRGVDGVILCAPQFSSDQGLVMQSYGLPMVIVNNEGTSNSPFLVYNDDFYGSRLLTRHLIELGHRRITYLGNQVGGRTTVEREAGFREEMRAAGLEVRDQDVLMASEGTPLGGRAGTQQFLALTERSTAIMCYNDNMAIGVYSALLEAGLRIPDDVSVVGYDDIKMAAYLFPPLTTLRQFKRGLGQSAATMMLRVLDVRDHGEPQPDRIKFKGELVIRASTAAAVQG